MDLAKIKNLGFQTIISLRPAAEDANISFDERAETEQLGLNFVRIPIVSASDLTDAAIKLLDDALARAGGRAFIHCSTGNRVGAALAMRAFRIQNKNMLEALALGEKSGLSGALKTAVEVRLRAANHSDR